MANVKVTVKALSIYEETFEVDLDDDLPEDETRDEFKGKSLKEIAAMLVKEGEGHCTKSYWVAWHE